MLWVIKINFVSGLYFSASQISFTSKYQGKTVTALVGASVNFTWRFSGDVKEVRWGLKKDGVNSIENNGVLVSLRRSGPISVTVPIAYNGRVSGNGNASSGQAIFTLSSIRKSDERYYGCLIRPIIPFDQQHFDYVYLVVKGELRIHVVNIGYVLNEQGTGYEHIFSWCEYSL